MIIHTRTDAIAQLVPAGRYPLFQPIPYRLPLARRTLPHRPTASWQHRCKRLIDISLALVTLVGAVPFLLVLALVIRLDSAGPALFRQRRIGQHGRSFELIKFRTMFDHQPDAAGWQQATRDDPRITRLGHFLRRTSLDELPQMLNVLRGEMSIVGPRPHAPGSRAGERLFEELSHRYGERHAVRPGITGLAQVRGWRGETETADKLLRRLDCDLEYIASWSISLDLRIIWRTVFSVLRMRNAY